MRPLLNLIRVRVAVGLLLVHGSLAPAADAPETSELEVTAPVGGTVFRLSEARGKYVVLHFLLKTECPFCQRHVRDYVSRAQELPDVVQVFLKPDSDEEIRRWVGRAGVGEGVRFPIYRDPEARWAKAFGIPFGYEFHGERVHYPALIVLDKKNREVFRHVGRSNADRFRFTQLMEKIKELKDSESAP